MKPQSSASTELIDLPEVHVVVAAIDLPAVVVAAMPMKTLTHVYESRVNV